MCFLYPSGITPLFCCSLLQIIPICLLLILIGDQLFYPQSCILKIIFVFFEEFCMTKLVVQQDSEM